MCENQLNKFQKCTSILFVCSFLLMKIYFLFNFDRTKSNLFTTLIWLQSIWLIICTASEYDPYSLQNNNQDNIFFKSHNLDHYSSQDERSLSSIVKRQIQNNPNYQYYSFELPNTNTTNFVSNKN